MWLCSAGLSNPIQLLQFSFPEVLHLESELYVSQETKKKRNAKKMKNEKEGMNQLQWKWILQIFFKA